MRSLVEQLRGAYLAKRKPEAGGMTLDKLIEKAGLAMSRPSLSKKLSGGQVLTTDECERLARALGVALTWDARPRRRAV